MAFSKHWRPLLRNVYKGWADQLLTYSQYAI
jgi:hypothetical protein